MVVGGLRARLIGRKQREQRDPAFPVLDRGRRWARVSWTSSQNAICLDCGARLYTRNLGGFPGMVFVTIGSLDNPGSFAPRLEARQAPPRLGGAARSNRIQ